MEKLSLILFAATILFNNFVEGTNDCTPPWLAESNQFLSVIKFKTLYSCPSIFGDPKKEYCCYNSDGEVECCNYREYLIFSFICSIPIIIIVFIILTIITGFCCFLCPPCIIYKRRRT